MSAVHADPQTALELGRSFVVDGPAGSGKAELAWRRYVAALAAAAQPEEVLLVVDDPATVDGLHERVAGLLAAQPDAPLTVRDAECDWGLGERPWRLQIHTLDSLALALVAAAPVASGCGGAPRLTDDAEAFYATAVRGFLRTLDHDDAVAPNLETLLLHLDNDLVRAEKLLGALLRRRAELQACLQFDRLIDSRSALHGALEDAVVMTLTDLVGAIPADSAGEIVLLAGYAARQSESESGIGLWRDLRDLPPADVDHRQAWQGLAGLLLDADGELRREVDERCGFPAAAAAGGDDDRNADLRRRMQELLDRLRGEDGFAARLAAVQALADVRYTHRQWTVLQSLLAVLPGVFAGLAGAFRALGETDRAEIMRGAIAALRDDRAAIFGADGLRHLIVEELQDFSFSGMALLEGLTEGWRANDGHSVFLTGDAFASIRRSDGAEPALYLSVLNSGLAQCALELIELRGQHRSGSAIVAWVNRHFEGAAQPVVGEGEMPYSPATPEAGEHGAVTVHALHGPIEAEGEAVARLLTERPELRSGRVAVLLGDAAAARPVGDALQAAGLDYVSEGVEPLAGRSVVRDLHALTRALCHLADRVAWLSVLRAPWCGLTLPDLHRLTLDSDAPIWQLIGDERRGLRLSADGQQRLARVRTVLEPVVAERGRHALRQSVEDAWIALGGAACMRDEFEFDRARQFLRLLERLDDGGEPDSLERLDSAVRALRSRSPGAGGDAVLVTTIDRARRRTFDTVVLAGVAAAIPPQEADDGLRWLVRPDQFGQPQLLLAPVGFAAGPNSIDRWLGDLRARRHEHELRRLLYVGSTRATRRLHVLARLPCEDGRWRPPPRYSPLATVWDRLAGDLPAAPETAVPAGSGAAAAGLLRRLPLAWQPPSGRAQRQAGSADMPASNGTGSAGGGSDRAAIATRVLRRVFHEMANQGVVDWAMRSLDSIDDALQQRFTMLGIDPRETAGIAAGAAATVRRSLEDDRARWFLDPSRERFAAPLALTGWRDERLVEADIDLSFVADGVRWIIGLVFADPAGPAATLESRLAELRPRWEDYAALARRHDPAPLRVGLYDPQTSEWHEWQPPAEPEQS